MKMFIKYASTLILCLMLTSCHFIFGDVEYTFKNKSSYDVTFTVKSPGISDETIVLPSKETLKKNYLNKPSVSFPGNPPAGYETTDTEFIFTDTKYKFKNDSKYTVEFKLSADEKEETLTLSPGQYRESCFLTLPQVDYSQDNPYGVEYKKSAFTFYNLDFITLTLSFRNDYNYAVNYSITGIPDDAFSAEFSKEGVIAPKSSTQEISYRGYYGYDEKEGDLNKTFSYPVIQFWKGDNQYTGVMYSYYDEIKDEKTVVKDDHDLINKSREYVIQTQADLIKHYQDKMDSE